MKRSIRTRFLIGMIFLFMIILVLSVFSGYIMNKLAAKTGAILKENYLSVVYARDMSQDIMSVNQQVTTSFLTNMKSDSAIVTKHLTDFSNSLKAEKDNITEKGESSLVAEIEHDFSNYENNIKHGLLSNVPTSEDILRVQKTGETVYKQLQELSRMNGRAIEEKTDDAKATSKSALTQITVLATLCFLIGMSFTFSFASYFNQRFLQLFHGIKEIVASNYDQRLFFEGNDEFYEISLVFNEMADKLKSNKQNLSVPLQVKETRKINSDDLDELKKTLLRIKSVEEQASVLISRIEQKLD